MSNILIEANNISKIYDPDIFFKRGTNFRALNMIDFTLKEHDFVAIMGPSGSGKSTLLNCLSTLDQVSSGVVKIGGENVLNLNDVKLSTFRYQHLGFVFQNHNLIDSLSIFDNIATPIMFTKTNPKEIIKRVQELAKTLNITHLLNRKPDECSGGEKQRCLIHRWNDHNILWSKK
ncbi:ABC transporter ATP-binding protein [uncultured Thomasclavelia sp.]|uniref:ABC transporter ATP-binding protein n=1 Tax=uncultured Thomasclavelia sp. TaxID=3025759 RepID=UPI0025D2DD8B|nr:ATP-binding cassette domain-containing protein [uncultured Thomasclavelia sp.]